MIEDGKVYLSDAGLALMDVVDLFRTTLSIVRGRTRGNLGITLTKAELHLKAVTTIETKVGGKLLHVIPIEGSVTRTSSKTQDLTLVLRPNAGKADLGKTEAQDLADAIVDLAEAAIDIKARVESDFDLESFGIAVDVEVTKDGKLQVVAGAGRASETAHSLDLSFRTR